MSVKRTTLPQCTQMSRVRSKLLLTVPDLTNHRQNGDAIPYESGCFFLPLHKIVTLLRFFRQCISSPGHVRKDMSFLL